VKPLLRTFGLDLVRCLACGKRAARCRLLYPKIFELQVKKQKIDINAFWGGRVKGTIRQIFKWASKSIVYPNN
jgi:hypothetical protein